MFIIFLSILFTREAFRIYLVMNTIREIEKINHEELDRGIAGTPASWHAKYSKSAWIYMGNLDHELTEGDILCVVSQYGEVSHEVMRLDDFSHLGLQRKHSRATLGLCRYLSPCLNVDYRNHRWRIYI